MNNFFFRGLVFCIPIFIYAIFILLVDPYEFINFSHIIDSETKIKVIRRSDESLPRGHMLWKTTHFKRHPAKNILIGDSQGVGFDEKLISNLSGEEYYNFCISGASYETMFKTFWFATETTQLKKVYFQLGFMNYNAKRSYDIFHFAQDYIDKPYLYFTTKEILFDSFYNFMYKITKDENLIKYDFHYEDVEIRNIRSKEILELFFKKGYKYPDKYFQELKAISEFCFENNIQLNFIIMPIYKEAKNYFIENNLLEYNQKFKQDIKSLGKTYDYEIKSGFSMDRDNFYDYFHNIPIIYTQLAYRIWAE